MISTWLCSKMNKSCKHLSVPVLESFSLVHAKWFASNTFFSVGAAGKAPFWCVGYAKLDRRVFVHVLAMRIMSAKHTDIQNTVTAVVAEKGCRLDPPGAWGCIVLLHMGKPMLPGSEICFKLIELAKWIMLVKNRFVTDSQEPTLADHMKLEVLDRSNVTCKWSCCFLIYYGDHLAPVLRGQNNHCGVTHLI